MIEPGDVQINTFSSGIPGVNASYQITMLHLPSGLSVSGTGPSGIRLRRDLIEQLAALVDTKGEGLMEKMTPRLAAMVGLIAAQCSKIEHMTLSVVSDPDKDDMNYRNYFYLTTRIGTRYKVTVEIVEKE